MAGDCEKVSGLGGSVAPSPFSLSTGQRPPFELLPHPPTARLGGRAVRLGEKWLPQGPNNVGPFLVAIPHKVCVVAQDAPPCPPRVGQVTFVSSLDNNRNILTDYAEVTIVIYRRKEPRPALQIAVGIAQTLFGMHNADAAAGSKTAMHPVKDGSLTNSCHAQPSGWFAKVKWQPSGWGPTLQLIR